MNTALFMLAQAATAPAANAASPAATPVKPWWQILLENGLPLTLLFIFLVAIVGVIVKLRRKDKCLKFFDDYHVTYLTATGKAVWGDLVVYSQGVELRFNAPYITRRGLTKSSAVIYEKEMASCLALCRVEDGLTDEEKRDRKRQVRKSFRPGIVRRTLRWMRNIINTLRDAFSKALTAIVGQLAKARPGSTVLSSQQTGVNEIGQTLLGAAGNAYEPILEAHIGKPVILKLASTTDPTKGVVEVPGYLVDYSDQYIAVFNVDHEPVERVELELSESTQRPGLTVEMTAEDAIVSCTGPEFLVVRRFECAQRQSDLAVALMPGCTLALPREADSPVKLVLERTRQIDMVAPRSIATVHFAAETVIEQRHKWLGLAPEHAAESKESVAADGQCGTPADPTAN